MESGFLIRWGIVVLFVGLTVYPARRFWTVDMWGRHGASWLFTGLFCVVPFVLMAAIAHLYPTWAGFLYTNGPGPLICSIFNLAGAVTLLMVFQNPHARRLIHFYVLLGVANISSLLLCLPPSHFSVWYFRLGNALFALTIFYWFTYWRCYFEEEGATMTIGIRWIKGASYAIALLVGATPLVLARLDFDPLAVNTAMPMPGPLYKLFSFGVIGLIVLASVWVIHLWRRSREKDKLIIGVVMFGTFLLSSLASAAYFLFVEGNLPWFWYPILEWMTIVCLIVSLVMRMGTQQGFTRWFLIKDLGAFGLFALMAPVIVGLLSTDRSIASVFISGVLCLVAIAYMMFKVHGPILNWVDQAFVFRVEFGRLSLARQVAQKEWNLDSLDEALPVIAQEVIQCIPYLSCTIAIMFEDQPKHPFFRTTRLRLADGSVIGGAPWPEELVRAFLHLIRRDRELWLREQMKNLPPVIERLDPLLFAAVVPLETDGNIVGVVVVGPKEGKKSFHDPDIQILATLARTLSQRLRSSVGLNLFRCVVNNTLHDVLGQDLGPLLDQLMIGYPMTTDVTLRELRKVRESLKGLRSYAQGELAKGRFTEHAPLDVGGFLKEIHDLNKPAVEKKGLELRLSIPDGLPQPRLDALLLGRCVGNLMTNAIKYTVRGWIELAARSQGNYLIISVNDSGIGIPAESLPRIFEEGYRVPGSASELAEGTGIGLANVQEMAVALGGRVDVASVLGQGSRFSVVLLLAVAGTIPKDKETPWT